MLAAHHPNEADHKTPSAGRSLAYLASQYPALSMVFILREVLQLRQLGFRIHVASINRADYSADRLTADESAEEQRTYYLKAQGAVGAARAHLTALFCHLPGYLRGLALLRRLSGLDLRRLFFNLMYLTEALMLGHWMQRKQHTHLHCHLGQQAATVGLYVKQIFGFGYSITVHGPDEFYDAKGQNLRSKIAAADFICCISSFARSQLMFLSPYSDWKKFLVVRLGVDTARFAPQTPRPNPAKFEILCIGRLTAAKGQHLLIDAVARMAEGGRPVQLRLVGDGAERESLQTQAALGAARNAILFEGAVNQDRLPALYAAADLFALPSFAEGIPVVLMEAMAMGLPCVSTQIAGIPELIRDGIDGLLVPASDLDELVAALTKLMDDAPLRKRIAESGRKRILEQYDLHRNVEQLAEAFRERVKN